MLLDSAFANPNVFKKLRSKANVTHVRFTYGLSPTTEDQEIYNLAIKENRFVVTLDDDFKKLIKNHKSGVLIIPSYLHVQEIDELLSKFLSGKNPDDFVGKATKIKQQIP